MKNRLSKAKRGKLVGMNWLENFINLSKVEQRIVLLLLKRRIDSSKSALTNAQISEELNEQINRVTVATKSLVQKDFMDMDDVQLEPKTKPQKHYWIPSSLARSVSDPAFAHIGAAKIKESQNQSPQLEPTTVEGTLKKIDPDRKLGYAV